MTMTILTNDNKLDDLTGSNKQQDELSGLNSIYGAKGINKMLSFPPTKMLLDPSRKLLFDP